MSAKNQPLPLSEVKIRTTKMYDNEGRTRVPKDIRDQLGLSKGDTLVFALEGEDLFVFIEKDEEGE